MDSSMRKLVEEQRRIETLSREIDLINPYRMMEKGWSYMISNGEIIKSPDQVNDGDRVITQTSAGTISSIVVKR